MKDIKHDTTIDILRLISILAVIAIHTTTRTLEISHYDLIHNLFTLFLNQASRFAVPLFFLISGFVLEINESTNIKTYFKKRIGRIFIPYIFWSLVYYFLIYTKHTDNLFTSLMTGSASYQLYFIPSLFIFYLIFPVLKKINFNKYLVIILFVIQIFILNYDYQYHIQNLFYPIAVSLFNFFLFLIGIVFARSRNHIKQKLNKFWIVFVILGVAMSYFIFKEGFTNYYKSYNYLAFYSQWRPSILIYTLFIFVGFYLLLSRFKLNLIAKISKLSFFVFFIHVIILELVWKYVYLNSILFFILVSAISFAIAFLSHKVKYLNKITG